MPLPDRSASAIQNTKWRNQTRSNSQTPACSALAACHAIFDTILIIFAHDEDPASSISADYIGFVIPGLGVATSSPFVAVVGDPLLRCTDVLCSCIRGVLLLA